MQTIQSVNSSSLATAPQASRVFFSKEELQEAVARFREPAAILRHQSGAIGVALGGGTYAETDTLATLPALYPEWLGDRSFCEVHGVRFPYVTGAMANGIATTELVIAMARAEMLGFFGAAGLAYPRVEAALEELLREIAPGQAWGMNLIHSPNEPELEERVADLYIRKGVPRVSAAAYLDLSPAIVRYAYSGVKQLPDGSIHRERHVFAKISRPEVATHFMKPAPASLLQSLVERGWLTADEARIASMLPVAEDITVEADSGGHTDKQSLTSIFPTVCILRDQIAAEYGYSRPIRIGAAGGIGTPQAAAAAFSLGAAYILTGSVNQGAIESGLSTEGKKLLAQAKTGDVMMAPAADMFEQGVEVQVLKRGTMFPNRAHQLLTAYRQFDSLDAIDAATRKRLEKSVLGISFEEVRENTRSFWAQRDPSENEKAARDPKHEMALCFRWYLGLSSRWAITGEASRRLDYQIWCGPAMASFNDWVRGSFLEPESARTAVQIALNLLEGAATLTRAQQLRTYGAPIPAAAFSFSPRVLA